MGSTEYIESLNRPEPKHSDKNFCLVALVKKGRGKNKPSEYSMTYIPWDEINDTELVELCKYGLELREEMEMWKVVHRGLDRELLIQLIRGEASPRSLEINPVHLDRGKLNNAIHSYWKYIRMQIHCNTCCWECPDLKPICCVLENREFLGQ